MCVETHTPLSSVPGTELAPYSFYVFSLMIFANKHFGSLGIGCEDLTLFPLLNATSAEPLEA